MLKITSRIVLVLALAALAPAQTKVLEVANSRTYAVYSEVALTSASTAVTIQSAASNTRDLVFGGAVIYCSAACVITLETGGTAATATAGSIIKLNTKADTSAATAWTASNVGTGTVINKYPVAAGAPLPILKGGLALGRGIGSVQNFTLRSDSVTATVRILLMWSEE